MATSSWFITAADARNNVVKDIVVHSEISSIENQILQAVKRGDYEVTINDGTLMTASESAISYPFTVDPTTSELLIAAHPYQTGDVVQLQSTNETPPPLVSGTFYYVIYISENSIKLAISKMNAVSGIPIAILLQEGVNQINVQITGDGYIAAPTVIFNGGNPTTSAQATAYLQNYGSVYSVNLLTSGGNFTDVPNVTIDPVGQQCSLGPATFQVISATVVFGGNNYNVGDLIYGIDGQGSRYVARVVTVNGGSVLTVIIQTPGNYTVLPVLSGHVTSTSGFGAGCSLRLVMGIASIPVVSGGNNYLVPPIVTITGSGTGATAIAVTTGGAVTSIVVTTPGIGFVDQPTVLITSGSGATATARIVPTTVSAATVTFDGGGSYSTTPNVTINTIGTGATVLQVLMQTVSVDLVNAGVGYVQGDYLLVSGGVCSQSTTIQVLTTNASGNILTYNIINSGSYSTLPQLLSNNLVGGTGVGASFNLMMGVSAIVIGSGGSGYIAAPLAIITGDGTGAAAYGVIASGAVTSIVVTSMGTGYTFVPTVTISGGSGATAVAVLNQSGSIAAINITNSGANYTHVPIITIDGGGTAQAIMTPTSLLAIDVTAIGQNYTSNPIVTITQGTNQTITPIYPVTSVTRSFGVLSVNVTNPGANYQTTPTIQFSAPTVNGSPATATAVLGSGIGTFSISGYTASLDYYTIWKNNIPSNNLLIRPYNDQMNSVITYFTGLGYSINRITNSVSGNTLSWYIQW